MSENTANMDYLNADQRDSITPKSRPLAYQIPVALFENQHILPRAKLLYAYLLYREKSGRGTPTNGEMGEAIGAPYVTVWRLLNSLENYGFLRVRERVLRLVLSQESS